MTTPAAPLPAPGTTVPAAAVAAPLVDTALVLGWFGLSLVWTILGPGIGLLAAMKLDDPTLLPNQEWLQFGRLRIAHVNAVIFLTFTPAMFGFMCYAVPKLCARPLWGARAAWVSLALMALLSVSSPIAVLLGHIQFIEAGEQHLVADVFVTVVFVLMTAVVLGTVMRRREPKLYVTLWYWIAALVWTVLNYPLGNFILPYVPTGVTSAEMNGFYLHAVVGLWITPAGVGAVYYLVPVATRAVLYSHRLSLIGFWALAFFYPLNGVHHYLFSPIPDWVQTIAIASSMMLIIPVWAFSVNMWGTMRGQWSQWAGPASYALKFSILGAVWYLITCFQGPTMALRHIQALTHGNDYNVGHAHSSVYAVFVIWGQAAAYLAVPRMAGRELWSTKLAAWHYWTQILGFSLMFLSLTVSAFVQGHMLQQAGSMWVETLDAIRPYWVLRTLGGTTMDVGLALFVVNMVMTMKRGRRPPAIAEPDRERPAIVSY
jgi:cbb3-type cytochrome c oxidase subunit I